MPTQLLLRQPGGGGFLRNGDPALLRGPVDFALTDADTAAGVDAVSGIVLSVQDDPGAGADAESALSADTTSSDTLAGVDDSEALALTHADTGSGTDAEALAAALTDADTGTAVEAVVLAVTLTDSDAFSAAETESVNNGLTRDLVLVFLPARSGWSFGPTVKNWTFGRTT